MPMLWPKTGAGFPFGSGAPKACDMSSMQVDVSAAPCLFDIHATGVDPANAPKPATDLHVALSCPWSASTSVVVASSTPCGLGNFESISSSASGC